MFKSVINIGFKVAETKAYKSTDILKSGTLKRRDVVHARPQRHILEEKNLISFPGLSHTFLINASQRPRQQGVLLILLTYYFSVIIYSPGSPL